MHCFPADSLATSLVKLTLSVVLLGDVEGVEEVVVVVDGEVDGSRPGLYDLLQVLEHVHEWVGGQLPQLLPLEQRDHKLSERVLPPRGVWVHHHGVVGLGVVAQAEVLAEQHEAQGRLEKKGR